MLKLALVDYFRYSKLDLMLAELDRVIIIKKLIRNILGYGAGVPGVFRHLLNLEAYCNSKFSNTEGEISSLKNEIAQLKDELSRLKTTIFADEKVPEVGDLFSASFKESQESIFDQKLPKTIFDKFEGASVLEISSSYGERAQIIKKFPIKKYIGFESSAALLKFATNNIKDNRFAFQCLDINISDKLKNEQFDVIIYVPSKKSFALEDFKSRIKLGLETLAKGGTLIVEAPYPLSDFASLGFDSALFLEKSGLKVQLHDNLIIAS